MATNGTPEEPQNNHSGGSTFNIPNRALIIGGAGGGVALETRPEPPMLREMGYSLRRLSTHKWIVGTLCIHHDGEGDNNTSDAQRQKLGKLAFRPDF